MDHFEHRDRAMAAFEQFEKNQDPQARAEQVALGQFHAQMAAYELNLSYLSLHGSLTSDDVKPASPPAQADDPRVRPTETHMDGSIVS
jgi:hypothetical protein